MGKLLTFFKVIYAYKNWPTWFLVYFKVLKTGNRLIKTRNGLNLLVRVNDSDDIDVVGEIFHLKAYQMKGFKIKPKDIVIDIGAHAGFFSAFAADKAKFGKVFAFEPVKRNFELLKENIKLNNFKNVFPINKGVLGTNKKVKIYLSDRSGRNSIFKKMAQSELIDCVSINDIFEKNKISSCDYLKIDCEGAEFDILNKIQKKNLVNVKKIVLEYHEGKEFHPDAKVPPRAVDLKNFLEANNFEVTQLKNNDHEGIGMIYAKQR